jgi:hypothetical protein
MTAKKRPSEKQKGGRPTDYCEETAALICERVATNTVGLLRLCAMFPDMPTKATINLWRFKHPEFSAQYAQAKLMQTELLAEECLDIADDSRNDWMESLDDDEQGEGWRLNGDHVNRCRLRIDTRKFFAAKLLPKKYGKLAEENPEKKDDSASLLERIISGEIKIQHD